MAKRGYLWGLMLLLGLVVLSGCMVAQAQGQVDPPVEETEPTPVPPPNAAFARDAVLTFLRENERLDLEGLSWTEQNVTQEGLVGGSTFEFTAGDWAVRVSFPVVNPADTLYTVLVTNTATEYEWTGEVDASGCVNALPDETTDWYDPARARDAALAHLGERFPDRAPELDLDWTETDGTPGAPDRPLPGATSLHYEAGNWVVTVDYPVVRPDMVEYEITVSNEATGFRWVGKVAATGEVIESSPCADDAGTGAAPSEGEALVPDPALIPDAAMARDAVMAYLDANYRGLVPVPMPDWHEEDRTPQGLVGGSSFSYRGKEWIVAVSFPLGNPAATVYQVTIDNEANGFRWEGQVDAMGEVTEQSASGYTEPPETDEDEYKIYFSKKFGYMFRYPRNCAVVSGNLDEALQVSTATTTGEGWPCLSVTHYDTDFYHPPAGTDVAQWILDWGMPYDELETGIEIAGSPAVQLITNAAPGAYAYDEYYFVKGEQLFRILIVHCGNEDWDLYNLFLSSFIFPGA